MVSFFIAFDFNDSEKNLIVGFRFVLPNLPGLSAF